MCFHRFAYKRLYLSIDIGDRLSVKQTSIRLWLFIVMPLTLPSDIGRKRLTIIKRVYYCHHASVPSLFIEIKSNPRQE